MKAVCLVSLLLAFCISFSAGRVCWHCENARSETECLAHGFADQCLPNQFDCQNEIRSIGGRFSEMTKRCKQDMACDNNQFQNISGSAPYQCEDGAVHRVCRCCCSFDNCNKFGIDCPLGAGTCEEPESPENGYVLCYNTPQQTGDTCIYKCNLGYDLEGVDTTVCEMTIDGPKWTNKPPLCVGVSQCDVVYAPEHGSKSCTDGELVGSVCSFVCDDGYIINGPESIVCNAFGFWDKDPPKCVLGTCPKPKPDDENRVPLGCTDKFNLYSTCKYGCKKGWILDTIYDSIECGVPIVNGRGSWDKPAPTCTRDTCPDPPKSGDKTIECTESYLVGSKCKVRCAAEGHYMNLDGSVIKMKWYEIECKADGWDKLLPDCERVTCRPEATDPKFGTFSCTLDNIFLSVCDFICNDEYHITGAQSIQCLADNDYDQYGKWSARQPTCDPDGCKDLDNTEDKEIKCSDGYLVNSYCDISCKDEGFYLERNGIFINKRTERINCKVSGSWDRTVPDCLPVKCLPKTSNPAHGSHSCTLDNTYKSVCDFVCDDGYSRKGEPSIQCLAPPVYSRFGKWSDPEPTCIIDECEEPDVGPEVEVMCPEGYKVGAKCTFKCKKEGTYELLGDDEAECKQGTDGIPTWNWKVKPSCVPMYCDGWDPVNKGVITCVPPSDQVPGDGDRWRVGTVCTLKCERPDYNVKTFSTSRCVGKDDWNIKTLCCVECVVNPSLDMVVLLDSSYATAKSWADYEVFAKTYPLELLQNKYNIKYWVIPYATTTDLINDAFYRLVGEDDTGGLDKLSLPFEGTGESNAGAALKYVNDDIFKVIPRYRVPIVILVTTRRPTDFNLALEQAKIFENRGIHLRIVPLVSDKNADAGKNLASFEDLTADDNDVIVIEDQDDFYTFATDGIAVVTKMMCNDETQGAQKCV